MPTSSRWDSDARAATRPQSWPQRSQSSFLDGASRVAATAALVLTLRLAVFSAQFLVVPAVVAAGALLLRRGVRARCIPAPA